MRDKLGDKLNILIKLIEENDEFILTMCETTDDQDFDDLADSLLRYLHKKKVIFF